VLQSWLRSFMSHIRQSWLLYLIIAVVFTSGVISGGKGVNCLPSNQVNELARLVNKFTSQAGQLPVTSLTVVKSTLADHLIIIGIVYLLGLTVIGVPLILGLIFGQGFIFGFTTFFLVQNIGWPGFFLFAAAILPAGLLYLPALIIGAGTAISFSLYLVRKPRNFNFALWPTFLRYTLIMLVTTVVILASALIKAYFSSWLTQVIVKYF